MEPSFDEAPGGRIIPEPLRTARRSGWWVLFTSALPMRCP